MRDYHFGNFLRELRVRRGLSQFQLGALVGVSDKAVSKWENGSSKPQTRILYQLSEVLGITVDGLLTCRYRSADPHTDKGSDEMKKANQEKADPERAFWEKASRASADLYGDIPPIETADRYFSESAQLKHTGQAACLDLLGRIAAEAQRIGGQFYVNGGIGASFTAFIIGASRVNPLRPHYYCPACHKIQFAEDSACGWDLPGKKCACGREMIRDGHDLPLETLRLSGRLVPHYDVSVSRRTYQAAEEAISSSSQETQVIPLPENAPGVRTYLIPGAGLPCPAEGAALPPGESGSWHRQFPSVTLIFDEKLDTWEQLEEETGIPFESVFFTDREVFDAFLEGNTRGIPEFQSDYARTILSRTAPASVGELIQIPGLCHGTGVWEENGQKLSQDGLPLGCLPAYRDDVFRLVQEKVTSRGSLGTGFAWHVMENVRRGVYARNGLPAAVRAQLLELGLDERLIDAFQKIRYLFPKAHGIQQTKYSMILMWYKIYCPEAFRRIIRKDA